MLIASEATDMQVLTVHSSQYSLKSCCSYKVFLLSAKADQPRTVVSLRNGGTTTSGNILREQSFPSGFSMWVYFAEKWDALGAASETDSSTAGMFGLLVVGSVSASQALL